LALRNFEEKLNFIKEEKVQKADEEKDTEEEKLPKQNTKNVEKLKKFEKRKTQKAIKHAIDTLTQLDDGDVFDSTDAPKMHTAILLLQRVFNKFEYSIK
jgi:hypothetical protein